MQSFNNKFRNVIIECCHLNKGTSKVLFVNIDHLIEQLLFINGQNTDFIPEYDAHNEQERRKLRATAQTRFTDIFKHKNAYNVLRTIVGQAELPPYSKENGNSIRTLCANTSGVFVSQSEPKDYYVVQEIADFVLLKLDKQYHMIVMSILAYVNQTGKNVGETQELIEENMSKECINSLQVITQAKKQMSTKIRSTVKDLFNMVIATEYKKYINQMAINIAYSRYLPEEERKRQIQMLVDKCHPGVMSVPDFCESRKLNSLPNLITFINNKHAEIEAEEKELIEDEETSDEDETDEEWYEDEEDDEDDY